MDRHLDRMKPAALVPVLGAAMLIVTGCASGGGRTRVSETERVYRDDGLVCREVETVERGARRDDDGRRAAATVAGAVAGAVVGNQVGDGRGRDAARVGGAVAGGVVGNRLARDRADDRRDRRAVRSEVHRECRSYR